MTSPRNHGTSTADNTPTSPGGSDLFHFATLQYQRMVQAQNRAKTISSEDWAHASYSSGRAAHKLYEGHHDTGVRVMGTFLPTTSTKSPFLEILTWLMQRMAVSISISHRTNPGYSGSSATHNNTRTRATRCTASNPPHRSGRIQKMNITHFD